MEGAERQKTGDIRPERRKIDNATYEKELARLQIELVKLQEWIKHEGLKVVVIFEGRDAAGKGGVIKRITESLNPRICRVVALGRPTERRAVELVLPALRGAPARSGGNGADGPQLVQPRRGGTRNGILHRCTVQRVSAFVPRVRADAHPFGHHNHQVLVLGQRRRTGAPISEADERPHTELEAESHGCREPLSAGSSTPRPRTRCSPTPTSSKRPGLSSKPT